MTLVLPRNKREDSVPSLNSPGLGGGLVDRNAPLVFIVQAMFGLT